MSAWNMKPNTGGGDWELPPAGNLPAVCVGLIDLGTQQDAYQGKPREVRQLAIVWELAGEQNSKTGRNHLVAMKFNASLHAKAALRKTIDAWRGVPLKDDEEFDLFRVVGAPCLLQISHDKTSAGNDIYVIDAVASLPKGMPKPATTFSPIQYQISQGYAAAPKEDWLPHLYGKKISELISQCIEFRSSVQTGKHASQAGQQPAEQAARGNAPLAPPPSQDAESIPF